MIKWALWVFDTSFLLQLFCCKFLCSLPKTLLVSKKFYSWTIADFIIQKFETSAKTSEILKNSKKKVVDDIIHIYNFGSLWTLFNTFLMQILLKFDEHPASLLFNNLLREKRDPPQSFVVDFLVKTFLLKIMQSTFKFQHPIALKLGSVCVHILTGQAKIQHLGLHHCPISNSSNRKKNQFLM